VNSKAHPHPQFQCTTVWASAWGWVEAVGWVWDVRGMGMGRRAGGFMQATYPGAPMMPAPPMTKEQEIQMLRNQMKILQDQLEQIKKRLRELGQ